MKLVTFQLKNGSGGGAANFGRVDGNSVVAFPEFPNFEAYLRAFPESEAVARKSSGEKFPLAEIRFLPPVPNPPALIDFALAPRHLEHSIDTFLKREYGPLTRWLVKRLFKDSAKKKRKMGMLDYYKANHHSMSGDGEEIVWPDYTAYLDLEAELGVVIGTREHPIIGYTILNDWSARDVQMPEMFSLSLTRSKDFSKSYGLGPYLVTPDEIPDPLRLKVDAQISGRYHWEGNTSEYACHPLKAIEYLRSIFDPVPGTVIGMGTVTGCCGLEHDLWIRPGDEVKISIEGLGTLRQRVPNKAVDFKASRWGARIE